MSAAGPHEQPDIDLPSARAHSNSSLRAKPNLSRERILVVAAQLFRENGYRGTNLQEVADHFGVRRPAIYYYFEKKSEILVEIHQRLLHVLVAQLEEVVGSDLPPAEKLARVITGQVELYAQNIDELAVFIENEAELPRREYLQARREKRRYNNLIEDLYRSGVADGVFVDADPKIVTFAITGVSTWMYRWYDPRGPYSPIKIAEQLLRLVEHGYLVPQDLDKRR